MQCAPVTKDWSSWENRRPPNPPGPALHVFGKVETNSGAIAPTLRPTVPQGINPSILMLDLGLQDNGYGTDDVSFRDVVYQQDVSYGGYTKVQILWKNDVVETIEVKIVE